MKLPFAGPSKGSIKGRYSCTSTSLNVEDETPVSPDHVTRAALSHANRQILQHYSEKLELQRDGKHEQLLGAELSRLSAAGYVLGRIESGTENRSLRFSALAEEQDYEAREFHLATVECTATGVEQGVFSQRPRRAMAEVLAEFSLEAAQRLLEGLCLSATEAHQLTEACARAINLGREIALMEDMYLNPIYRDLVLEIRSRIQKEQALRLRLAQEGFGRADDVVNETMRRMAGVLSGQTRL